MDALHITLRSSLKGLLSSSILVFQWSAMVNSDSFPLYVFEKDDWSMFLVESPDDVWCHIEPIDFENDEYLFWDAHGRGVCLTLQGGKLTRMATLTSIEESDNEISLNEAFVRYSQALGVTVDTTGTFAEVWFRLQSNVKPKSRLSRAVENMVGVGCLLVIVIPVILLLIGSMRAVFRR